MSDFQQHLGGIGIVSALVGMVLSAQSLSVEYFEKMVRRAEDPIVSLFGTVEPAAIYGQPSLPRQQNQLSPTWRFRENRYQTNTVTSYRVSPGVGFTSLPHPPPKL